jgi:uncharacterized membrane protein YgaE (UPF0421/DUF939 family)
MPDETPTTNPVIEYLRRSIQTAINDDHSEPRSEKRHRHVARVRTMGDAIKEIERLRAELEAAAADIAMLIQKETDAANAPPPVPKAKP